MWLQHFQTGQLILKPRISASSENTVWMKRSEFKPSSITPLNSAFADRDFMVQPFVSEVVTEGEYSLFYIGGRLSHTIRKVPKGNDYRVQEELGGKLTLVEQPSQVLEEIATEWLRALRELHDDKTPLYARLDVVRSQDKFVLMEMELIERSVYLNFDPNAPKRFAEAIVSRVV